MVTHQLQVERRTGKVRRPETDVLPLCHATNLKHQRRCTKRLTMQLRPVRALARLRRLIKVTGQRPCRAILHKWGLAQSPSCYCGWPATDHELHCRHVPINETRRRTESTPRSGRRRSRTAGIYSDCCTREIIKVTACELVDGNVNALPVNSVDKIDLLSTSCSSRDIR